MRIRPLTRSELRNLDAVALDDYGLATLVLMENAGRGAAELLREQAGDRANVLIVCGPGNNGGDAGVVARFLDAWGWSVRVVWLAQKDSMATDAAVQFHILSQSAIEQCARPDGIPEEELAGWLDKADWIVDGIFGTGLTRPIGEPIAAVVERLNTSGKPILALDIPSGLDCDTGEPLGTTIQARMTASFVASKVGFSNHNSARSTGDLHVIDIGLPRKLLAPYQPARFA